MPSLNIYHDFNYGWYGVISNRPEEVYKFADPAAGAASNATVRRFAQVVGDGRPATIQAMENGEIFSMNITDGGPIHDTLIGPADSIILGSTEIWAAEEGETLLMEAAEAGESLLESIGGVVMLTVVPNKSQAPPKIANFIRSIQPVHAFMASSALNYSIKITNGLRAPLDQPKPVLKLVKWHLVSHWWVNRTQSPPDGDLVPNDEAHLSWSFMLGPIVAGGIMGYYDGWVSYELPNGQCFGVRIHIPTQVGPIGTRPSYQTKFGSKEEVSTMDVDKWDYHDDPSQKYVYKAGDYHIELVPTSGSDSLALDVQVSKKA